MTDAKPVRQERWQFLDAIRGIAALAVVFQHVLWYVSPTFESFFATVWSPGRFGVVAFFIVSGFIVPQSLESKGNIRAFWTARFYRLFPAYWSSLLLIAIVLGLGLSWHPPISLKYLLQWLVNLTMLQEFVKIQDINPVAWTLGLELALYGAITLAFARGFLKRTWLIAMSLLFLLAVASTILPNVFHIRFPAGGAAVCSSIILGLVLYRWFTGSLANSDAGVIGFFCLAVTILSAFANYSPSRLLSDPLQPTQLSAISSVLTGYVFFIVMFLFRGAKFPNWTLWLGKVSYSLYLLHPVTGMVFPKEMNHWARAVLEIVSSLTLAWLGYKFIEEPFIKIGKRRIRSLKN
ncbi:MAG: acyltransferase [Armatimonadetes bacterium]|nr:acyltransferase [Armatimonadota bacterium]